jgi:hypothetical protein
MYLLSGKSYNETILIANGVIKLRWTVRGRIGNKTNKKRKGVAV